MEPGGPQRQQAHALAFLGELERSEAALLTWGIVDGFFSREEVLQKATGYLARTGTTDFQAPQVLVEWLEQHRLLWKIDGEPDRYRTRMAETLRLLSRLRQMFFNKNDSTRWRTAKNLVADFRLLLKPRSFPKRRFSVAQVFERLAPHPLDSRQRAVLEALLRGRTDAPLQLAQFQLDATRDILHLRGGGKSAAGTLVSAGTGSGKTLAFYLPAFTAMARWLGGTPWTKCIALYPRNELLKDQLREALGQARRANQVLPAGAKLSIGVLFGDVPNSTQDLLPKPGQWSRRYSAWERVGPSAVRCPLCDCPLCNQRLVWSLSDLRNGIERLTCESKTCDFQVGPEEVRLTRQSLNRRPADLLFTTTEMLNQRMATPQGKLFGVRVPEAQRPRLVLLDEVHTYEGVHGAQVALLLRRWQHLTQARPHFVGLSATLVDANRFFAELIGTRHTEVRAISPEESELEPEGMEYQVALRGDPVSGVSLLSTSIQALMLMRRVLEPNSVSRPAYGKKVFAFTDNLDVNNRLYFDTLDAEGWLHNGRPNPRKLWGSLATLRAREHADPAERMTQGQSWALAEWIGHSLAPGARAWVSRVSSLDRGIDRDAEIVVATSSLEVGFDDPEVGAVLQHKAPLNGASFLQRKGRAGRRREMRPWTLVTLSDFGRDRLAYQGYEQLFSPVLAPRYLPVGNQHVLKMQATYSLIDWLCSEGGDTWVDTWRVLSTPLSEKSPSTERRAKDTVLELLRGVLETPDVRERFTRYLRQALRLDEAALQSILWEPPRALFTTVIPTSVRRLERNWTVATARGAVSQEAFTPRSPLPEFIPRALFGDLNIPDVQVLLKNEFRHRPEWMPIAQALTEFAPGRVSHRFSIQHSKQRNWVPVPKEDVVRLETFCDPRFTQSLGRFPAPGATGTETLPVVRPLRLDTEEPPEDILPSSNAFLSWNTVLRPPSKGLRLELPRGSPWLELIVDLRLHSHALSAPVAVTRFTDRAQVSTKMKGGTGSDRVVHFVRAREGQGHEAVGLGFTADVDALVLEPRLPEDLVARCAAHPELLRALRSALFRQRFLDDPRLEGLVNSFQRAWIAEACLSTLALQALQRDIPLSQAWESFQAEGAPIRAVLDTLFMALPAPEGEGLEAEPQRGPRHEELLAMLGEKAVQQALGDAVRVLWTDPDASWEPWLRRRVRSTLGVAFLEAIRVLCSQIDDGDLLLDLDAQAPGATSHIHLTEASLGGAAVVEEFLLRYGQDPRRFFGLLEAALAPSDFEENHFQMCALLERLRPGADEALAEALDALRQSETHHAWVEHTHRLRRLLSDRGFLVSQPFVTTLFARVLRPGSSRGTDALLARLVGQWDQAEARLGIELEPRIVALLESAQDTLDAALAHLVQKPPGDARAWRFSNLLGLLWPRGSGLRAENLKSFNPYTRLPASDRLLVEVLLPRRDIEVRLEEPEWPTLLADRLLAHGQVRLSAPEDALHLLREALLDIQFEPLDAGALLVHPRVRGTRREAGRLSVLLDLPEAAQ